MLMQELVALKKSDDLDEVRWEETLRSRCSCGGNARTFMQSH